MKKLFSFFSLALALLLVFACDLRPPKAIQIKGSPELKFAANWEFDIFSDMMESAFGSDSNDGLEINECINAPQYKTYLIRLEIYNDRVTLGDNNKYGGVHIEGGKYKLSKKEILINSDTTPKKLPFSGFGDYLDGLKLKTDDVRSKLYVDGSDIVTAVTIQLTGDVYLYPSKGTAGKVSQRKSADNAHTLTALPEGGIDVVLPAEFFNSAKNFDIGYEIYFAQGDEIEADWLGNEYSIKAELVIWIPMEFVAAKDNAEIKLDSFQGIGDFFTSVSESGFIESLKVSVGMSANPFKAGTLVIRDSNHVITNPMNANAINFALSEKDIEYINEYTFEPEFSIIFKQGAELKIPKVFSITTISMTAKLDYTVEFGGD